ncbi:MAG: DUF1573 domain-containing protein [Planctomycetes bacterium]|nr:DUF1573 domain-containing protein [Planctomycetota bacterium]
MRPLLAVGALLLAQAGGLQEGIVTGPDLVFERTVAEWGSVVQGERVSFAFRFSNRGASPLAIGRVQTSCDCTAAPLERRTYAPGESGELVVTFDSGGRTDYQEQSVLVFSDDPGEVTDGEPYVTRLVYKGEVVQLVRAMPPAAYFPDHDLGREAVRLVRLTAGEGLDPPRFRVLGVESFSSHVQAEARPAGPAWEVEVRVLATAPLGPLRGEVVVRTDVERQPQLRLPVAAVVLGDLLVSPTEVYFGAQGREAPFPQPVVLATRRAEGLRVLEVLNPSRVFEVEVVPIQAARRYELWLRVRDDAAAGPFAERVRVLVDDADEPQVELRVVGEVLSEVAAEPPAVYLEGQEALFALARREGAPFAVLGVSVEGEGVRAALDGVRRVRVRREGPAGTPVRARVVVTTDVPGQARLEVEVRGAALPGGGTIK